VTGRRAFGELRRDTILEQSPRKALEERNALKILHYMKTLRVEDGGVVRAVLNLCRLQAEAGADVTLITYDSKDAPQAWLDGAPGAPRVVTVAPPNKRQRLGPQAIETCRREIDAADCVHLHAIWSPSNAQIAAQCRAAGRPYVITIHGMLDDWSMSIRRLKKRLFLALYGKKMIEGAYAAHCCSEEEKRQSHRWYPKGKAAVIPLAVDLAPFRELPGPGPAEAAFPQITSGQPVVLFLSRLHPVKGVDVLIKAIASLKARGVGCQLVVAGAGDEEHTRFLHGVTAEQGLEDAVHFVGMVRGVEKVSLYQAADVFVLPSLHENFGFVLPESLAAETPAVTTRFVGLWDELEQGGGVLVADREPDTIAEQVARLLADADLRRQMGRSGRAWVFEHLGGKQVISAFLDLYQAAADGR